MINDINFRGPDDQGMWHDDKSSVYLAHARLAIIDLSQNAQQPIFLVMEGLFLHIMVKFIIMNIYVKR